MNNIEKLIKVIHSLPKDPPKSLVEFKKCFDIFADAMTLSSFPTEHQFELMWETFSGRMSIKKSFDRAATMMRRCQFVSHAVLADLESDFEISALGRLERRSARLNRYKEWTKETAERACEEMAAWKDREAAIFVELNSTNMTKM